MSSAPLEVVLARLDKVKGTGKTWTALCPAHDDHTPSLSVGLGDNGRVLLNCHKECTAEAICDALGLAMKDLFVSGSAATRRPHGTGSRTREGARSRVLAHVRAENGASWGLVRSYPYTDANCTAVMEVLRFEPSEQGGKTFRPIHASDGGWTSGDPRGPLPLFRLPELEGASLVFVCEGEKAVVAAVELDITVTTNAHGAKAAAKTDWSPLEGVDVVLLPDNDPPGRIWASDVADLSIDAGATSAKVVELPGLPDHGDIVEFIEHRRSTGNTNEQILDEIYELVANAHPYARSDRSSSPGFGESERASGSSGGCSSGDPESFPDPQPLPADLPPVTPFDPGLLPDSLRPWVEDVANRMQCPIDFPAVAARVAYAAVVGRQVRSVRSGRTTGQ